MSDVGRFTLTVEYDEPNPNYEPGRSYYSGLHNEPRINRKVLSVELTPKQWADLKRSVLEFWEP